MKIRTFAIAAGMLALGLAAWNTPSNAQGPLWDRVNVNLPYSITIGDKTLQPGDYVIQQLSSNSGSSRVLLIYSDRGMKFETSAMTIPALEQQTPEDTKVILHHFGPDYYFDKIWIQGKNYGYEFPLPDSVKARERERLQPISVAATYQTVPAEEQTTSTAATQATTAPQTMAQNTVPPATAAPVTPAPVTETPVTQAPVTQAPVTTAPTTMPPSTMPADATGGADRSMPETSAGWLMMLLGGGALSGAGLAIRRKR